jgi:L-amino acid N-acyltransferase YncA
MIITAMLPQHANEVLEIYDQGIQSGMATFVPEAPEWEKFTAKYLPFCRFVSIENNVVAGWAAIAPVSPRECYKGVAEVSLYVHNAHKGKGIGKALLMELITSSEQHGIWSLLSVIHEENNISIQLHDKCGFRMIGYREKIAQLNGKWTTTVMMERRSKITGI